MRYLSIPSEYSDDEYLQAVLVNALDAMAVDVEPENFTVHTQNSMGDTPLQFAVAWGDVRAVRLLVEAGSEIDCAGEMGCTPLYNAIIFGWSDIAEYLVQRGANPDIKSEFGDTSRELALNKGFKIKGLTL